MAEILLSVGIDIGTSTTQLVISQLTLENRATPFSVPRVAIVGREVRYRSAIHFTPLKSDYVIDTDRVRDIVVEEYRKSGYTQSQISTGAVIITGETARKENAREVLSTLSSFAGDFVVATAGPDLESILAARGAGADGYAKEHRVTVLNFDIGGGTSNLALYRVGELVATGCMDIGGRLIKMDPSSGKITYLSAGVRRLPQCPQVGDIATPQRLAPVISAMVEGLAQAAGLCPATEWLDFFRTRGTRWTPPTEQVVCSFSGGVADCIYDETGDWLAYGDVGVLLGRAIAQSPAFAGAERRRGVETIRATVVGAGSHTTEISGSTIFYRGVAFPLKNLPILKLTEAEERGGPAQIAAAIGEKLRWFAGEDGVNQIALALRGERSPPYPRVQAVAEGVIRGLEPLIQAGFFPVVVVEHDMAKVLGQAIYPLLGEGNSTLLCLDGVAAESTDYIDIGAPVAGGNVLPVIIKTLVFQNEAGRISVAHPQGGTP